MVLAIAPARVPLMDQIDVGNYKRSCDVSGDDSCHGLEAEICNGSGWQRFLPWVVCRNLPCNLQLIPRRFR